MDIERIDWWTKERPLQVQVIDKVNGSYNAVYGIATEKDFKEMFEFLEKQSFKNESYNIHIYPFLKFPFPKFDNNGKEK